MPFPPKHITTNANANFLGSFRSKGSFSGVYEYSFNTQMHTDEISGTGNHTTALFWEYDTRLGRRWNLDPKPVAWESQYAVNRGNPILLNDPNGDFAPAIYLSFEAFTAIFLGTAAITTAIVYHDEIKTSLSGFYEDAKDLTYTVSDKTQNYLYQAPPPLDPIKPKFDPTKLSKKQKIILATTLMANLIKNLNIKIPENEEHSIDENSVKIKVNQVKFYQDLNNEGKIINKLKINYEVRYKIAKGDNLTKIAKRFNTTVEKIKELNNIENINKINEGQEIIIEKGEKEEVQSEKK